jgi:hypothetical protein
MDSFAVVEFCESNTTGVVPKSWIVENELPVSMCSANTSIMKNIIIIAPHTMKRSG